jgi:hypothetical protein
MIFMTRIVHYQVVSLSMNAANLLNLTKDEERSWIVLHFHVREFWLPLAVGQERLLFVNDLSAHCSALWMDDG